MPEQQVVVNGLQFSYEGLFNATELYKVVSSFFFDKGYDWWEKMNQEMVTQEGRDVRLIFEPWKNVSDFYKLIIKIKLNMLKVNDVEVELDGQMIRTSRGLIEMTIDGYIIYDRKGQWLSKPFYWMLMIFVSRYLFMDNTKRFNAWLKSDIDHLVTNVKKYLNVYNSRYGNQ